MNVTYSGGRVRREDGRILDSCKERENDIEEGSAPFANAAESLEREASGLVRITCPPDVADVVVAPLLRELLRVDGGAMRRR